MTRTILAVFASSIVLALAVPAADEVLTNALIIELTSAGLSAETVLAKIQASRCEFDLSSSALVDLKKKGVADSVIRAMLDKSVAGDVATARPRQTEAVMLLVKSAEGGEDRVALDPAVYHVKTQMGLFRVGSVVVLPGREARVRSSDATPRFLVTSGDGAPPRYVLSRLEGSDEGGGRQIDAENSVAFDWQKGPGGYHAVLRKPLKRGEYCFYHGALPSGLLGTAGVDLAIFDFGVDGAGTPARRK